MSIPAAHRAANLRPWYREPWPWLLMAAPLAAVVMGIVMIVLATRSEDGLVADDYYKRGLAINQTLDRADRARTLGLDATVMFDPARTRARLNVPAASDASLTLRFVHPTRAGLDQAVKVERVAAGLYEGAMAPPAMGQWHLSLEDASGTWRLAGVWIPADDTARLDPGIAR
jgi:hypothetical protein